MVFLYYSLIHLLLFCHMNAARLSGMLLSFVLSSFEHNVTEVSRFL